jgi:hypothetical protein
MRTYAALAVFLLTLGLPTAHASPVTTDYINAPDGLTVVVGQQTLTFPSSPKLSATVMTSQSSDSVYNKTFADGSSNVLKLFKGSYDFAASGGGAGSFVLGAAIPNGAIIRHVHIDVITAPNTSTGSPTIALTSGQAAGDLLKATTYSNLSVGQTVGKILLGTVSTYLKTTSSGSPALVIASGNISTGKLNVYLDYSI